MLSDGDVEIVARQYGKNYVRLLHVTRRGTRHIIKEVEVNTALTLASVKDFIHGDNSDIIATDSQKNTVYILAKQYGIPSIEEFALQLSNHFLQKYPHVIAARIHVEQKPWNRVKQAGQEHAHAFVYSGEATRFCEVLHKRHQAPVVSAGIKDLQVMKTTQSAFVNFVKDEYRSLPDMDDRIFGTVIFSRWTYTSTAGLDYCRAWSTVKDTVMEIFAGPPDTGIFSPSVQKTLYDIEKLSMSRIPQISTMHIELPNIHSYQVDYSKFPAFGISKNNEVFQPVDKPSGNIQATLSRKVSSKL